MGVEFHSYHDFRNGDEYGQHMVAHAYAFKVCEFLGGGKYASHGEHPTLEEARSARDRVRAQAPKARLMVYALTRHSGRVVSTHVE